MTLGSGQLKPVAQAVMPKKRKAGPATGAAKGGKKAKAKAAGSETDTSWLLIDEGEIGSRYADPEAESPRVGIDGIIQLAEDLQIEVEDPVFLVLAWEMRAEAQGVFKRSEVGRISSPRSCARYPSSLLPASADSCAEPLSGAGAPVVGRLRTDLPGHQGLYAPRGRSEEEATGAPCEALTGGRP